MSRAGTNLRCASWDDDVSDVDADRPQEWSFMVEGEGGDDGGFVGELMRVEVEISPAPGFLRQVGDLSARQDSIAWMLKVHGRYCFRPATACLAVNYLDRFLSGQSIPKGLKWPYQLLAVACLAVAAKMEETTEVPPLLDLQVMEPPFVFESGTVCRMELVLMAALGWRLSAVTPYDFLYRFATVSGVALPSIVFSRAADLVLRSLRLEDFTEFHPSVIAAAAIITGAGEGVVAGDIRTNYEELNEESVTRCHRLMEEYLVDSCPCAMAQPKDGGGDTGGTDPPPSPVGVLDAAACSSCDTASQTSNPGSDRDKYPNKRCRLSDG